jgi:hypothetical protein
MADFRRDYKYQQRAKAPHSSKEAERGRPPVSYRFSKVNSVLVIVGVGVRMQKYSHAWCAGMMRRAVLVSPAMECEFGKS